jgi:hypothetical protein
MIVDFSLNTGENWNAADRFCFYCSEPIQAIGVQWLGGDAEAARPRTSIFLHAACAVELAMRLLGDVHAIEERHHQRIVLAEF